jgi:hypothetical protein
MKHIATAIGLAALMVGTAASAEPKYAGFDVTDHEDPKMSFVFSSGDATSASPIVISAPGRRLTDADRVHRVDLQKHWLSLHVPKGARLLSRALVECGLTRKEEFAACDRYVFEDPASKLPLEFYIYVGNWP